jgi:hypothetical protein
VDDSAIGVMAPQADFRPSRSLESRNSMIQTLCESCASMREVITPKGSRFLLCQLSITKPDYPKYPKQPFVRCDGYQKNEETMNKLWEMLSDESAKR